MTTQKKAKNYFSKFPKFEFFGWFVVFLVSTSIIAIERFTPVYINNFYVRMSLYFISGALLAFWVSWILFGFKAIKWRLVIFACVLIALGGKAFLTWPGDWKTQTIFYTNRNSERETIEYQMRGDRFAFGYRTRIVQRKRIAPFFDYVRDIDTIKLTPEWSRTDKNVNQLKLKNY